eukprot:1974234-Prorocentrum_lima.AAC.1
MALLGGARGGTKKNVTGCTAGVAGGGLGWGACSGLGIGVTLRACRLKVLMWGCKYERGSKKGHE